LGAARGHFGAVLVGVGEALVRFEAAVEVVDGEQLEVDLAPVAVVVPGARSRFGGPGGDGEGGGRQRGRGGRGEAALPSHGGQWRSRFHRGGAGLTAPAADRCWDDRVREYNITDGQGREKASSALRVFFIIMPSDGAPPAVPHSGSSGSYSNLLGD